MPVRVSAQNSRNAEEATLSSSTIPGDIAWLDEAALQVCWPSVMRTLIAFVLSSTLAGFAGVVYTSMINGASAFTGEPMLMTALTVLMLGSVMKSGVYNVPGTILAAILLAMISNGMTMMNSPDWVDDVIQGSVLLLAICSMSLVRIFEAKRIEREAMVVQEQLAEDN